MEAETEEVLDWGNEDDEQHLLDRAHKGNAEYADGKRPSGDVDDVEDAVSLGGDDDDGAEFTSASRPDAPVGNITPQKEPSDDSTDVAAVEPLKQTKPILQPLAQAQPESLPDVQKPVSIASPQAQQSQRTIKITHALPPKPVAASVPYIHPSHPSIIEATAMSIPREKHKSNGSSASGKPPSGASTREPPLPPDWEIRYPRTGGRDHYYYNVRTHQSTWTQPVNSSTEPASSNDNSDRGHSRHESHESASGTVDGPVSDSAFRKSDTYVPRQQSIGSGADWSNHRVDSDTQGHLASTSTHVAVLSYEDRHYRPGDVGAETSTSTFSQTSDRRGALESHRLSSQRDQVVAVPSRRLLSRSPSPPQQKQGRDRQAHLQRSRNAVARPSRADSLERHWVPPEHQSSDRRQARQQVEGNLSDPMTLETGDSRKKSFTQAPQGRSTPNQASRVQEHDQAKRGDYHDAPISSHRSPRITPRETERSIQNYTQPREPSSCQPAMAPATRTGEKSRFDEPTPAASKQGTTNITASRNGPSRNSAPGGPREHDVYIPSDITIIFREDGRGRGGRQRGHVDAAAIAQPSPVLDIDVRPQSQMRISEEQVRTPGLHSATDHGHPSSSAFQSVAMDDAVSTHSPTSDSQLQPRRKRQPLPPQSERFREASRLKPERVQDDARPPVPSELAMQSSLPPRSREPHLRSASSSMQQPPSGPRHQAAPPPMREANSVEYPRGPRASTQSQRRPEQDRRGPRDSGTDLDVEYPSLPSVPSSVRGTTSDLNPLLGYADREPVDLPKGPRAMVSRPPQPALGSGAVASSGTRSPVIPPPSEPSGGRRQQSPPPHLVSRGEHNKYPERNGDVQSREDSSTPAKRGDDEQLGHLSRIYPLAEPLPNRYDQPRNRGRQGDGPHSTRPTPLSGTNSVPIGTKRMTSTPNDTIPPRDAYYPPATDRADRVSSNYPADGDSRSIRVNIEHEQVYLRGEYQYNERRSSNQLTMFHGQLDGQRESMIVDNPPPPARDSSYTREGRPEIHYSEKEIIRVSPRYETRRPSPESSRLLQRDWHPRDQSPRRVHSSPSFTTDEVATPPPPSREPSLTSPTWKSISLLPDPGRQHPPEKTRQSRFDIPRNVNPETSYASYQGALQNRGRYHVSDPPPRPRRSRSTDSRAINALPDHPSLPPRPHGLPNNPTLHSEYGWLKVDQRRSRFDPPESPNSLSSRSDWVDQRRQHSILVDHDQPDRHQKHDHPDERRRLEGIRDPEPMDISTYSSYERLPVTRRGGSLLDRLSLDRGSKNAVDEVPPAPLRERVQVPAKRDRDMMTTPEPDHNLSIVRYEQDDIGGSDVNSKRRRRSGKAKRGKR